MIGLFDFEQDGRYPLRRIPMIMRFNLDACGIKISLTAWITLSRDERERLISMPCVSAAEMAAYRDSLIAMLAPHADNPDAAIEWVEIESLPAWKDKRFIPETVQATLAELNLPQLDVALWSGLTDLQRFALLKLTRSGHKNANLLPALKEFSLA